MSTKVSINKTTPKYIIIKLLKTNYKENTLKVVRQKKKKKKPTHYVQRNADKESRRLLIGKNVSEKKGKKHL